MLYKSYSDKSKCRNIAKIIRPKTTARNKRISETELFLIDIKYFNYNKNPTYVSNAATRNTSSNCNH